MLVKKLFNIALKHDSVEPKYRHLLRNNLAYAYFEVLNIRNLFPEYRSDNRRVTFNVQFEYMTVSISEIYSQQVDRLHRQNINNNSSR